MALRIDQVGLPAGEPGYARKDGLSTGAQVTLIDTAAGGSTLFEILWVSLADTTSRATLAPTADSHIWQFTPTVGVKGPIRIRLTHMIGGSVTTEIRILGIPDANGNVPPAPGERSDPNATLLNLADPAVINRCERNWRTTTFPAGNPLGWSLEALGGGSSSVVTPPTSSTANALKTTGADVAIAAAAPPTAGQVLTGVDATHADWRPIPATSVLKVTPGDGSPSDHVSIGQSAPPEPGAVLTALNDSQAEWSIPDPDLVRAALLAVNGESPSAAVYVKANPPLANQVLTAIDETSAEWRTPTTQPVPTAADIGLANVTNDAQLKRAANDFTSFPVKSVLTTTDVILLEDAAASFAKKRTTVASVLAVGSATPWSVATNINPRHWWRASVNTQSGGLVDVITDSGRIAKNFSQTGTARAPIGTDSNGKSYLALDGANDYYTAGVVADWTFLHNALTRYTIYIVFDRGTMPASDNFELMLCTGGWTSGAPGIFFATDSQLMGVAPNLRIYGPSFICLNGSSGSNFGALGVSELSSRAGVQVVGVRFHGFSFASSGGNWGSAAGAYLEAQLSFTLRYGGINKAFCYANGSRAPNAVAPLNPLTLGKISGEAHYSPSKIYEIMIEDRDLNEYDCFEYEKYARATYGAAL